MKVIKFYLQYWLVRLLYLIFIMLVLCGSYCYTVQSFSVGNHVFTNPFFHLHDNLPFWVNYIEYFILVFVISTVLIILLTQYYSFRKRRKERMRDKFVKRYYKNIVTELFRENEEDASEEKEWKYKNEIMAKNDFYKELVINTFVQVHNQTIGRIRQKTESMMKELAFEKLIGSYLYSPFYKHKKIALDTISEFKIKGHEKYLLKLIKQKRNKLLHTDALMTLIRLNVHENLNVLAETDVDISMWDINMIVRNIEKDNEARIPYDELINSANEGMQLLGIILIRIHDRTEFKQNVRGKTESKNPEIRDEAILTFSTFAENKDDFDLLLNKYPECSDSTKKYIVERMSDNPYEEQVTNFFEWVVLNEPIPNKLIAIMNLLTLDISKVAELKKSEDEAIRMACEQVLDFNN